MKNSICQSCGMPIKSLELYGTGSNGIPIEDYCVHCYKNGGFTSAVTMNEMIRLCANYVDSNKRNYYMANMRMLYPHLKRWAKKEDTQNEYYKSINRVLDYIKEHLHENTDLKTLAGIACISPYHFHRIFKSTIGESLAEYVNRLRMEYVAVQLKAVGFSLAELAERSGYSSEQALSRAFKNYFDLPPKTFKMTFFKETFGDELSPRICKVASRNIITLHEQLSDLKQSWQKLYMYTMVNRLLSETTESIELIRNNSYIPALSTKETLQSNKHVNTQTLPEGLYAIFTHKGDIIGIPELYAAINNYWLPKSKYFQTEGVPYIIYLNNPVMVSPQQQLTEIYIPITEK